MRIRISVLLKRRLNTLEIVRPMVLCPLDPSGNPRPKEAARRRGVWERAATPEHAFANGARGNDYFTESPLNAAGEVK